MTSAHRSRSTTDKEHWQKAFAELDRDAVFSRTAGACYDAGWQDGYLKAKETNCTLEKTTDYWRSVVRSLLTCATFAIVFATVFSLIAWFGGAS